MKFSTRAGYGLRASVNLARIYPQQKNLQDVAREEKISRKYLEQIFRLLKKSNLVQSQKGREGGYILAHSPRQMKVGEIIEALEGPLVPMQCAQGRCSVKCECASSVVWTKLQEQIKKTLYAIKLSDLI